MHSAEIRWCAHEYQIDNLRYLLCFLQEKLSEAHDECQRKSKEACEAGTHVIVIDNTNVRQWEMSYYTNLASKHSYVTVLVTPKTPWRYISVSSHVLDLNLVHTKRTRMPFFPLILDVA